MKKNGTIKFFFLLLLVYTSSSLRAQSLSITDSCIYKFNQIDGFTTKDSIWVEQLLFTLRDVPLDSIDNYRIRESIDKRKSTISPDLYFFLKTTLFYTMYWRFGNTEIDKPIEFGLELLNELKQPETNFQHELLYEVILGLRLPYRSSNRTNEGIKLFSELIIYYQQRNDSDVVSQCYHAITGIYRTLGLTERAIYSEKKSLSFLNSNEIRPQKFIIYYTLDSHVGLAGMMNRKMCLAQIYVNNNEPLKALALLYDVIATMNRFKNPFAYVEPVYTCLTSARAYALLKNDSAAFYFNLTKKYLGIHGDTDYEINLLQEKGYAFYLRDMPDSAYCYLDSCINIKDAIGMGISSKAGNLIPRYYLALLKIKQGNNSAAIKLLLKEIDQVNKEHQRLDLLKEYLLLAQVYKQSNDFENAAKYFELYSQLQNEISKDDVVNRSISFETEQAISKNENEVLNLAKDNEVKKRNNYLLIALAAIILIVAIGLLYRNRLKRKIEMERMRNRLSRDLHDDIGSTLSSINILSSTAQANLNQINPEASGEQTKQSLEKINERSQRLLDNMSDIIWNINPGNDTLEEVMSRMREYATTILDAKNIDFTFDFPKQKTGYKLSAELKNNLYLIFKEAVNNLSKYSGCTKANLSLTFDEKNIRLKIEDNGIGFIDAEIIHRGGLRNMQHRAEEIKGTLKIISVLNKGTTVDVTIPR